MSMRTKRPMMLAGLTAAWYEREIDFFPLWCVPYRRVHDYEWLVDGFWRDLSDELFLDPDRDGTAALF